MLPLPSHSRAADFPGAPVVWRNLPLNLRNNSTFLLLRPVTYSNAHQFSFFPHSIDFPQYPLQYMVVTLYTPLNVLYCNSIMYNVSIYTPLLPRVQLSVSTLLLLYPCILQNCYKHILLFALPSSDEESNYMLTTCTHSSYLIHAISVVLIILVELSHLAIHCV